jgi:nucleoid DNA-binding protein
MEALIKMITDKTGISQEQATTAIQTVISFIKENMPAGMGSQVDSFLQSDKKETFTGVADTGKMQDVFGIK